MSTTGATEQGTVYVLDEPEAIAQQGQACGDRLGHRDPRARRTSPGVSNLIEILAVARGVAPEAIEEELADARYGDLKTAVGGGRRRATSHPSGSATSSCAPTRAPGGRCSRRARRRPARSPRATLADVREAMGVGPGAGVPPPLAFADRGAAADLELDLDVFAGPFDLLLTLVLREEVDLLEVDLADVVLAYLDHLEAARRARPRGGDRVPRADRRAARAEVAADAAARGGRGAGRPRARARPPRSCSRGCSRRAATAPPPSHLRERLPSREATATAARRCRRVAPPPLDRAVEASTSPRVSATRSASSCARRRVWICATWRSEGHRRRAPRALRALLRRGRFWFDEAVAGRRPGDRGGDPLRAARALQAGGGHVGPRRSPSGRGRGARGAAARRPDRPLRGASPRDRPAASIEALLFLSPDPVARGRARRRARGVRAGAASARSRDMAERQLEGRGLVLREIAGGWALASDPIAEDAARRLLARRGRRRSPRPRPRRSRSWPTCSRSRDRRSPASAG